MSTTEQLLTELDRARQVIRQAAFAYEDDELYKTSERLLRLCDEIEDKVVARLRSAMTILSLLLLTGTIALVFYLMGP